MSLLRAVVVLSLLEPLVPRAPAQAPTGSILRMEFESAALYINDCPNAQLATSTNRLNRPAGGAFESAFGIADIVAVNGKPVKGAAYQTVIAGLRGSPNPVPRGALVDSVRLALFQWDLDLLNPDGTSIGTIQASGLGNGLPPPGAPREITGGGLIVTGGTGAFFGVRGYFQPTGDPAFPERQTSACEDPALRRTFADGGGKRHPILYLVPMIRPEIAISDGGPAVVHSGDGSLVTAAKPAKPGEVLTLYAYGLGPTRPGVDPGQPFPPDSPKVNSPVDVLVNGKSGEVLYAGGYAGSVDGYLVNFRIPDGTVSGQVSVQLTSAWIAGQPMKIAIQ